MFKPLNWHLSLCSLAQKNCNFQLLTNLEVILIYRTILPSVWYRNIVAVRLIE